jgi:hypothetical protein
MLEDLSDALAIRHLSHFLREFSHEGLQSPKHGLSLKSSKCIIVPRG